MAIIALSTEYIHFGEQTYDLMAILNRTQLAPYFTITRLHNALTRSVCTILWFQYLGININIDIVPTLTLNVNLSQSPQSQNIGSTG